jgi:membrane-associated protease RseP (regulator of RpoE activity)
MIGFEVFRRFVTEIDYARGTITFIKPEAFRPPADATPVPFIFYSHVPEAEGSFEGLPGKFDIDTGSRVELSLTKPFAERNGLREKHPKGVVAVDGWGVGGPVKSYVTRASGLKLGSVAITNVVTSLAIQDKGSFSDPTYDGNVGDKLLKRFAVTFDYFGQILYLKPRPGPVADADTFDRSGMWINSAADGFEITDVTPGGPASTAGLKVGDHIVAVNGAAADPHKLSGFRQELRETAPGTVLQLKVRRGAATSTVDLTLRDQI